MSKGWYKESRRHSLAARGISTKRDVHTVIKELDISMNPSDYDRIDITVEDIKWWAGIQDEIQSRADYLGITLDPLRGITRGGSDAYTSLTSAHYDEDEYLEKLVVMPYLKASPSSFFSENLRPALSVDEGAIERERFTIDYLEQDEPHMYHCNELDWSPDLGVDWMRKKDKIMMSHRLGASGSTFKYYKTYNEFDEDMLIDLYIIENEVMGREVGRGTITIFEDDKWPITLGTKGEFDVYVEDMRFEGDLEDRNEFKVRKFISTPVGTSHHKDSKKFGVS